VAVCFDVVVAADLRRGIAKDGQLPWKLPGDMKFFRELTSKTAAPDRQNAVIMGRKTWQSIPAKRRPLADRINVVLSRDPGYAVPEQVLVSGSLDQALNELSKRQVGRCFVIGGGQIYQEALRHPGLNLLYFTEIQAVFDCDTFFPDFASDFELVSASEPGREGEIQYCFKVFRRRTKKAALPPT